MSCHHLRTIFVESRATPELFYRQLSSFFRMPKLLTLSQRTLFTSFWLFCLEALIVIISKARTHTHTQTHLHIFSILGIKCQKLVGTSGKTLPTMMMKCLSCRVRCVFIDENHRSLLLCRFSLSAISNKHQIPPSPRFCSTLSKCLLNFFPVLFTKYGHLYCMTQTIQHLKGDE